MYKPIGLVCAMGAAFPLAHAQANVDLSQMSAAEFESLQESLASEKLRRELSVIDQQIETLRTQREVVSRRASGLPISPTVLPSELSAPELLDRSLITQINAQNGSEVADEANPDPVQPTGGSSETQRTGTPNNQANSIYDRFGLGIGIALTSNLSGQRVNDVRIVQLEDGTVLAQVAESGEQDIRLVGEGHFIFEDIGVLNEQLNSGILSDLAACGLFALKGEQDSGNRLGCGPFIALVANSDLNIEEFGIGHMLSLGRKDDDEIVGRVFNIGYGIMFDPSAETLDRRLLEDDGYIVQEQFRDAVIANESLIIQSEEAISAMLIFSTSF